MNDNLRFYIGIFLLFSGVCLFLFGSISLINYLKYKELYGESYNVRYSLLDGCEIQIKDISDNLTWVGCGNIFQEIQIRIYGVRR